MSLSMIRRLTPTKKRPASGKTRNALKVIDRLTGGDADLRRMIAEESLNAEVAAMIYAARTTAGLTQTALAELIGTKQSVIARLEDADYNGHSLGMLQRIATALNQRIEVRFSPVAVRSRRVRSRRVRRVAACRSLRR